ncbi:four helix bundle protein [Hymenobacter fastidiosus]|uniref:Four helix bundle protein n=1 Tax=Hymenobacter fastidiosus TaxID=486264 RepID=A0ABP7SIS0_9BACT
MSNEPFDAEQNAVLTKSYKFAVRMLKLYEHLRLTRHEYIVSRQAVRSGTSIGANVEEAVGAISKAEFSAKLSIAYKEARETSYWLRLLHDGEYLETKLFESLHTDCQELCKILFTILRSTGRA